MDIKCGTNIQIYRKQSKLRQADLAEAVGCSCNYIAQIETGRSVPSLALLIKIAEVLEVTLDQLLLGESELNRNTFFRQLQRYLDTYPTILRQQICMSVLDYFELLDQICKRAR